MADLAGDLESITSSLGLSSELAHPSMQNTSASSGATSAPSAHSTPGNCVPVAGGAGSLNGPLGDLFEEFRSELGESNNEDEDLETHYNLGIAYREMGLLEEAISEFQKVASSADKGTAFRYAMQCSTLLGLAFMEKGQPAIAAIWYERALKTPGLDQESILALRYDLGIAQELAGDKQAAYNSFSQVYAMNIDYRDVSERIALLGKAR
jgi:tetratricopeptide (TPR) repeat protein